MAYPKPVTEQPLVAPASRPVLAVATTPALAGRQSTYLPGARIAGDTLTIDDLAGFVWWLPVDLHARLASDVREDAGSVFEATTAIPVDAAISEAYPWGAPIESGDALDFREAFTPDETSFQYYAARTRNMEMRVTTSGETVMARLARTIPEAVVVLAETLPGQVDGTVTAQQAMQYVFDAWTQQFEWFAAEPVPDLRILTDAAVNNEREHYLFNPTSGVVRTSAIVIPQTTTAERDERQTMRDIIDEWLAIFPGTIVRANSAGRVELVPRVGPDLPAAPKALSWRDVTAISDGENDPRGIVNQATVESQGWVFEEEQTLMPPTFTLATRSDGLTEAALKEYLPEAEALLNGNARRFEVFADPTESITLQVEFRAYTGGNKAGTGGLTLEKLISRTITLAEGETKTEPFTWTIFNFDNETTRVTFTRRDNHLTVTVSKAGRYEFGPNPSAGMRYAAYLLDVVDATGTAWVRTNKRVIAQFGYKPEDVLADAEGGNAIANSISVFGQRGATINSTIFQLTPEQARLVARAYVMQNINPRTIREVRQSLWNRHPVRFDDVGRPVRLPNGELAIVESRAYRDASTQSSFACESTFTAAVTHTILDSGTSWLLFDDGTIFQLDDNTQVEES